MAKKQCPQCRKISKGSVASCDGCGFLFDATHRMKRGFAETCVRIGVAITIAASVTAVIAKLI
jgi:hypothetical protein